MPSEGSGERPERERLDEMQVRIRDRIGNQSLMIIFYALLVNIGLEGFGFKWLPYPLNIFIIMLFSMGLYLARTVWSGAYAGPRDRNWLRISVACAVISAAISAAIIYAHARSAAHPENSADGGGILVFVSSLAIMVTVLVAGIVSRWRSGKGE